MGILDQVLGGGAKGILDGAGAIIDRFHLSPEQAESAKRDMAEIVARRDAEVEASLRTEIQAKEKVLIAELQSGDRFTARARPMIVYAGLFIMLWNFCLIPTFAWYSGKGYNPVELPAEFWWGWTTVVSVYGIGRTAEKIGAGGPLIAAIAGKRNGNGAPPTSRILTG